MSIAVLLIAAIYCTYEYFNPTSIPHPTFKYEANSDGKSSLLEKVQFGAEAAITALVIGAIRQLVTGYGNW